MQESVVSQGTQTLTPLPPRLQVHVPIHCVTVKATTTETNLEGKDERFTLSVSVLDVSTGTPLKCVVALHDDIDGANYLLFIAISQCCG